MNKKQCATRPTVLVVDDNESIRDTIEAILKKDYTVIKVGDGEKALMIIKERELNVILLDIKLPGMDGIKVLKKVKEEYEYIEVIMITVVKEVETAVKAMKLGAYDYITKDFSYDGVANLVKRVIEKQRNSRELLYLRSEMEHYMDIGFIIGKSRKMKRVYDVIQKVAKLHTTVLITGESGTGKELIARVIHKENCKGNEPFVVVNIASIPEHLMESTLFGHEKGAFTGALKQHLGKFELANGGTIFLDEIGELKYDLQAKLLRTIQECEIERVGGNKTINVNLRVLAATNVDIKERIKEGKFREDLFYRLNIIPIRLPALRERIEDILQLVTFFIDRYNKEFKKNIRGITDSAIEILSSYHWPGNIRELENLIERLIAICDGDMISAEDIPIEYQYNNIVSSQIKEDNTDVLQLACDTFERNFILKTLEKVNWQRVDAADVLGIPMSTLKYKFKKFGIYDLLKEKRALS
ncbi:MAG: sigma-54-dependent Fis family transcriptional regulator [Nitrospinae bacterium]|nr:sigma-54-dependent Fis family transcriptional regulator [Nitrospinota bacterium]